MPFRNRLQRVESNSILSFFERIETILTDMGRHVYQGRISLEEATAHRRQLTQIRLNLERVRAEVPDEQYHQLHDSLTQLHDYFADAPTGIDQPTTRSPEVERSRFVGQGPPEYAFDVNHLKNLLDRGFSISVIAREGLLGAKVHRNTVYRHIRRNGLATVRERYSNLPLNELRTIVSDLVRDHPNAGHEEIRALLRTRNPPIYVQRQKVRDILAEVDPVGVATRWSGVVQRRTYTVPSPNSLWHIDSHHSLVRWGLYVHGAIDGYSRLIPYLKISSHNTSRVSFACFINGTSKFGTPSRVRLDEGTENVKIFRYMNIVNGPNRGSAITGKSVHNQRIERLWRDTFVKVLEKFYNLFHYMEESQLLDINNSVHVFCLQFVFLTRINDELEKWVNAHNNRAIRTENHRTPEQLWLSGILRQRESNSTAVNNVLHHRLDMAAVNRVDNSLSEEDITSMNHLNSPRSCEEVSEDLFCRLQQTFDVRRATASKGIDIYGELLSFVCAQINMTAQRSGT